MVFNSIEFFVFLAVVYSLYCVFSHKAQNRLLLFGSYIFYGWWDARFLYLIALSTCVDFCCGQLIHNGRLQRSQWCKSVAGVTLASLVFLGLGNRLYDNTSLDTTTLVSGGLIFGVFFFAIIYFCQTFLSASSESARRKTYLFLSVAINLGILGVFKYFNFFVTSAKSVLVNAGLDESSLGTLDILLPVGISFYTFQTMSYSIDIYRGKLKPCDRFTDFALFVAYFPQLVAGPIERASHLLPRIISPRYLNWPQIEEGLRLIGYGLFKKVVIADGLAASVSSVYGNGVNASGVDVVIATLCFTVQIYCDFSGYTDIARGVSKLLGIELMLNFKLPYFSRSPSEFWQRWHISLSSWLRDYLYIPLGGNRKGNIKTYRNLFLTMLLGGLWHGAAWNFIIWGGFHGLLLCVYRAVPAGFVSWWSSSKALSVMGFWLSLTLFFSLTFYGWLLFRAESFDQILAFTSLLFSSSVFNGSLSVSMPPFSALLGVVILVSYECVLFIHERNTRFLSALAAFKPLVYGAMLFIFVAALSTPPAQFIYFQF